MNEEEYQRLKAANPEAAQKLAQEAALSRVESFLKER
jgi:hypothetical protein